MARTVLSIICSQMVALHNQVAGKKSAFVRFIRFTKSTKQEPQLVVFNIKSQRKERRTKKNPNISELLAQWCGQKRTGKISVQIEKSQYGQKQQNKQGLASHNDLQSLFSKKTSQSLPTPPGQPETKWLDGSDPSKLQVFWNFYSARNPT